MRTEAYIDNQKTPKHMKKSMKYEEAVREIERIVAQMENDELDLDSLAGQLTRAQELLKLCRDKLTKTESDINAVLNPQDNPAKQ